MDPYSLDGNAAAGDLGAVLAIDPTTALATCASCGDVQRLASADAYVRSPGTVVRCTCCREVLLRFVRSPDRGWLDLGGIAALEVQLPAEVASATPAGTSDASRSSSTS
jgi:hypothetical protein